MTTATESILRQFNALSLTERLEFRKLINGNSNPEPRVGSRPLKLSSQDEASMQWRTENEHLYAGEWVALDGDRLIAHASEHDTIIAAVKNDVAELPMIYFVEPKTERSFLRV